MNAHLIIFFLTHSHYDHALGSAYILRHYPNAKVVAGKYAVDIFKRDGTKIISYIDKKFHNKTSKRQGIPAVFKLSINQFRIYDFCGSAADVIHPSNPLHLIVRFEFFCYALTLCHLFNQTIERIFGITVELK